MSMRMPSEFLCVIMLEAISIPLPPTEIADLYQCGLAGHGLDSPGCP